MDSKSDRCIRAAALIEQIPEREHENRSTKLVSYLELMNGIDGHGASNVDSPHGQKLSALEATTTTRLLTYVCDRYRLPADRKELDATIEATLELPEHQASLTSMLDATHCDE